MTATTQQMSANSPADAAGGADGPAAVAPSVAPRPRVIQVGDDRWFVQSASEPGAWRKVDLIPSESLTCSCPAGLYAGTNPTARPCRHICAVVDRMEKAAATAAVA